LSAAPEAAASAMPRVPNTKAPSGGAPAVDSNMPTTAVKVTSSTTLGLHNRQ